MRNDARTAGGHLVRVACGLKANMFGDTESVNLPEGSGWRKVKDVVYILERADNEWPNRGELRSWLTDEAVPTLRWALGDGEAIEVEMRPTASIDIETYEAFEAARDLVDDDAAVVIAIPAEVETAAAPDTVGPKKGSAKVGAAKAPKLSLLASPKAAEDLLSAVVDAADRESPRP